MAVLGPLVGSEDATPPPGARAADASRQATFSPGPDVRPSNGPSPSAPAAERSRLRPCSGIAPGRRSPRRPAPASMQSMPPRSVGVAGDRRPTGDRTPTTARAPMADRGPGSERTGPDLHRAAAPPVHQESRVRAHARASPAVRDRGWGRRRDGHPARVAADLRRPAAAWRASCSATSCAAARSASNSQWTRRRRSLSASTRCGPFHDPEAATRVAWITPGRRPVDWT